MYNDFFWLEKHDSGVIMT